MISRLMDANVEHLPFTAHQVEGAIRAFRETDRIPMRNELSSPEPKHHENCLEDSWEAKVYLRNVVEEYHRFKKGAFLDSVACRAVKLDKKA